VVVSPFLLPTGNTYLCLAVLDGVLCVIFLHGRNSPQSSPTSTPRLLKSLSFELQPNDIIEKPMSPMQYARSGLGTAELNGKLIAAGKRNGRDSLNSLLVWGGPRGCSTLLESVFVTSKPAVAGNAVSSDLLLSGGYNREECLRTVECYDPQKDTWTFIAPMRTPRARFQMAVLMVGGEPVECHMLYPSVGQMGETLQNRSSSCPTVATQLLK